MKKIAVIMSVSDTGKIISGEASDSIAELLPKAKALRNAGKIGKVQLSTVAILSTFKQPMVMPCVKAVVQAATAGE